MNLDEIAFTVDPRARKSGQGYMCRCPAHEDKTPSLKLDMAGDNLLWHCFAGCGQSEVGKALQSLGVYEPSLDSRTVLRQQTERDKWLDQIKAEIRKAQGLSHIRKAGAFLSYASALPPPEFIIGPFQTHTSGFIAAPGGSGKSMFTLGLAQALAQGAEFCGWKAHKAASVHLIDVEMSDPGLEQRLRSMGYFDGLDVSFDTSDQRDAVDMERFQLGPMEHMIGVMEDAADADVIIIDNVSACLTPEKRGDLFSPETWQQVFPLESWARGKGKLLIFVDHTNKAGQLAGSLHKHRMADFVCLLERTSLIGEPWLEFVWQMDKCRYDTDAEDVLPRLCRFERGEWTHSDPGAANDDVLQEVVMGNISKKEAAEELAVSRPTLDKLLRKYKLRLHAMQRNRNV